MKRHIFFVTLLYLAYLMPSLSHADCSSPSGVAGTIEFNATSTNQFEYCNGTDWIAMNESATTSTITASSGDGVIGGGTSPSTGDGNIGVTPAGHWKLDDTSGSTLTDSSGNGYNGTWANGAGGDTADETTTDAANGTALHFDGTDDYGYVVDNATFSGPGDKTWAIWFKMDTLPASEYYIFNKGQSPSVKDWEINFTSSSNKVYVYYENGASNDTGAGQTDGATSATFTTGVWYHIAATYDDSTNLFTFYVNGAYDSDHTLSDGLPDGTAQVRFGRRGYGTGGTFDGIIDDARIYSTILTPTQISNLYNLTKPQNAALISHHKLDDTSGSTIVDETANSNDGTWDDNENDDVTEETSSNAANGTSLSFDGDDCIQVPDDTSFDSISNRISFASWVYPTTDPTGDVHILHQQSGTAETIGFYVKGATAGNPIIANLITDDDGTVEITSSEDITDYLNTWVHLVGTYDGSTFTLYVDGASAGTASATGDVSLTTENFNIGCGSDSGVLGGYFTGRLDDIRIYEDTLTPTQVTNLYNSTKPTLTSSGSGELVGYWKLDETSGDQIADSAGSATGTWTDSGDNDVSGESVAGYIGTALDFSGAETIDLGDTPEIDSATGAFTVTAWIYPQTLGSGTAVNSRFISSNTASNDEGFELNYEDSTGKARFKIADTSSTTVSVESTTSLSINTLTHLAGVFEPGNEVRIYVNGVEENATSTAATTHHIGSTIYIGARPKSCSNCFYDGLLDEVRIYSSALPDDIIYALANGCSPSGQMYYNPTYESMRYCDNTGELKSMGASTGAGGGGCSASGALIAGSAGAMQYDTANDKMVYCDGSSWVNIPN